MLDKAGDFNLIGRSPIGADFPLEHLYGNFMPILQPTTKKSAARANMAILLPEIYRG